MTDMATELTVVLSTGTTTQCSIYGPPKKGGHIRLGSVVWLADDRYIGYFNPAGCYPICKHQGPERRPIPCPETIAKVFPTPSDAIGFVAETHQCEAPFTFTVPMGFGKDGQRIWKPKADAPVWDIDDASPVTPKPKAKAKKAAAPVSPAPRQQPRQAPATIEEMVAKAQELIKEEQE